MALDKIIVENFKAFKGEHIFDLRQLNIFTGANNSGKSTLIKAISLFSKGLEKGDFPSIDLYETDSGSFKDLVNRDSGADNFKIGFFIEVGEEKIPFKVMYEFVEDKNSIIFNSLKVFKNKSNELFFGIYNASRIVSEHDEENYKSYVFDVLNYSIIEEGFNIQDSFKSPSVDDLLPEFFLRINIDFLEKDWIKEASQFELIDSLKEIRSTSNFWWIELFEEQKYFQFSDSSSYFTIKNIFNAFLENEMYNMNNVVERLAALQYTGIDVEDSMLKHKDLLRSLFEEVFLQIEIKLIQFKKGSYFHVLFPDYLKKNIRHDVNARYLFKLDKAIASDSFDSINQFIRKSLNIFGIDGYIRIKNIENDYLQLNLVHDISKTDEEINLYNIKKTDGSELFRFNKYDEDYKNNRSENVADLGKGLKNLIGLILQISSIEFEYEASNWMYQLNISNKAKKVKPIVIIEEPEVYLHPNYQTKLADYLRFLMEKFDYQFIVETHNVYLIQRLQTIVASKEGNEGKFLDKLNIYFFNVDSEIEKEYKMVLRSDGIFANKFGDGFYDQTARLTIDLINLQNKN